ncbi:MAG: ATP synthase F1 subunit delta [Dehalococcoidia bacterium]|nr:MAG: ATP synthase F1 subunit delta [Dehalococcoidia bacterium]
MAASGSAKRYAQAVFQIAVENNQIDTWRSEVDTVAATLSDPQLKTILEDPKVHLDDKIELVKKCLPGLSQLALNLAFLLVTKQDIGIADRISIEYNRMADAYQGLEHARVTTAVELNEDDRERLSKHLATMTGKKVTVETDVDATIIGGYVARIGDKLLDGSTRAKLEALKKKLVEKA